MLAYTFNLTFYDEDKRILQSISMGIMYTALVLTLGHGNNGGHFNPAITIAVLM